jgi:signal transduction histidine kinase
MARFRTRARAVDMLGRQQIAGVPTAISELFKNAHDAYADNAIVDFYRSDRLFVVRDDGFGMTLEDYESRWLTLATESKLQYAGSVPSGRPGYPARAVMGEKGIGRLAVAAIGPQVLILSRPVREGTLGELLVSLIHWGVFEVPGVDLDAIDIPTLTLPGSTLPTREDVATLVEWVAENLDSLTPSAPPDLARRIKDELNDFRGVGPAELDRVLTGPSLVDGAGTHFFIRPADHLIVKDLEARERGEPSDLLKLLIGFTNTMTPDHPPPVLNVEFRDHASEVDYENVVAETAFFTPAEFERADQRIQGTFDETGQFHGLLRQFDRDPVELVIPLPGARGQATACGPFTVDVAYQQGEQKRTLLDPEAFADMDRKLKQFGGIYVYRDGIRVLPYGNPDVDFLGFEERRSISASDYFFSYRRMFGVIEISRARNSALREKAGREGFAMNDAYRQFREMLVNLFYQVAFQYFRETGAQSEYFLQRRTEIERLDAARRRAARTQTARRAKVVRDLAAFEAAVDAGALEARTDEIVRNVRVGLARAVAEDDLGAASAAVAQVEDSARADLGDAERSLKIDRPRGTALSKPVQRRYARYEDERVRLMEAVLVPARQHVDEMVTQAVVEHRLAVARQIRLEHAVRAAATSARKGTRDAQLALNRSADAVLEKARVLGRRHFAAVQYAITRVEAALESTDVATTADADLVAFRTRVERDLAELREAAELSLTSTQQQLDALVWPQNGDVPNTTMLDQVEALESDLEALSERADDQLELSQLGSAVSVINHEFRQTTQSIRRTLRQLKVWAEANPKFRPAYDELKASFDHLDGYLTLFTPLQRRLYRTEVEMAGSEIEAFLRDLFSKRLIDADIDLNATLAFRQHRLMGYPSTIYAVFVNLLDNSTFWLTDYRGTRGITLDAGDGWLGVRDTGPGFPTDLGDEIFEARVTTKPGGSGYGLFVARQVLRRDGMDIVRIPASADSGAELRIIEARGA